MVIDAILDWWFGLCSWLIDLFPTNEFPTVVDLSMIQAMNFFLPIGEMFGLFSIFFALGGVFASSSIIIWVLVGIVRGGSTKA